MLWPEKREKDAVLGDKVPGVIDRTNVTSWLRVPTGYLPDVLKDAQDVLQLIAPKLFNRGRDRDRADPGRDAGRSAGEFRPAAGSTSLRERLAHDKAVVKAVVQLVRDLKALPQGATDEQARQVFANVGEQLLRAEQMPGLRRQPRPLLRHQPQRRRQEGADRLPEDVLTDPSQTP